MKKIMEFKGYRSIVEYDAQTGAFVVTPLPIANFWEAAESPPTAEIVRFPARKAEQKRMPRRAQR